MVLARKDTDMIGPEPKIESCDSVDFMIRSSDGARSERVHQDFHGEDDDRDSKASVTRRTPTAPLKRSSVYRHILVTGKAEQI